MMKTVRIYIDMFLCITVYTLWKFPDMLPVFTTYPPVFDKLLKGAGKCVLGGGGGLMNIKKNKMDGIVVFGAVFLFGTFCFIVIT